MKYDRLQYEKEDQICFASEFCKDVIDMLNEKLKTGEQDNYSKHFMTQEILSLIAYLTRTINYLCDRALESIQSSVSEIKQIEKEL